jgi:hypothetical protein
VRGLLVSAALVSCSTSAAYLPDAGVPPVTDLAVEQCPAPQSCSTHEQECIADAGRVRMYGCEARYFKCVAHANECLGDTFLACLYLCDASDQLCEKTCVEGGHGPGTECFYDCMLASEPCSDRCNRSAR